MATAVKNTSMSIKTVYYIYIKEKIKDFETQGIQSYSRGTGKESHLFIE